MKRVFGVLQWYHWLIIFNDIIGKEMVLMVKMVIPLVPMVQMLPTNGAIGRTPNTRKDTMYQSGYSTSITVAQYNVSWTVK